MCLFVQTLKPESKQKSWRYSPAWLLLIQYSKIFAVNTPFFPEAKAQYFLDDPGKRPESLRDVPWLPDEMNDSIVLKPGYVNLKNV
jgi:hypothetical protein